MFHCQKEGPARCLAHCHAQPLGAQPLVIFDQSLFHGLVWKTINADTVGAVVEASPVVAGVDTLLGEGGPEVWPNEEAVEVVEPVVADVGTVNDVEDSPEPVNKHKIVKRNIERNYTVLLDNTIFRAQMVEISVETPSYKLDKAASC